MPSDDAPNGLGADAFSPFLGTVVFPPPSTMVEVDFGAASRRGGARSVNEDHYLIIRLGRSQETIRTSLSEAAITNGFHEHGYAMAVADGIGGSGAGEYASRLALATLLHLVRAFGKWSLRIDDAAAREIVDRVERFYRHVDGTMLKQSTLGPVSNLQTTLTATFSAGRDLFFAHVGHSRAYLLRGGRLLRLTRDHTVGRRGPARTPLGPLHDVSGAARDLHHILSDTLGMSGSSGPKIDLERVQLDGGDLVLVCTNGLTDAIDEETIADVLVTTRSPDAKCRSLVELAAAANSDDDVTALVAQYRIPEPAADNR
jgi:PPM family protein phosphatase